MKTRIKICGLTRVDDVDACAALGADAIGFVFYPPSPRAVTPENASILARRVPPFMSVVALFVDPNPQAVRAALSSVPISLLQFHGNEDDAFCRQFGRPFVKVARVKPGIDLLEYAARFPSAQAVLLDAYVESYGGAGKTFDWSLVPAAWPLPWILSGGLSPDNVAEAIRRCRPDAVDVSSGVEQSKGVKDHARIAAFIAEVRAADEYRERLHPS